MKNVKFVESKLIERIYIYFSLVPLILSCLLTVLYYLLFLGEVEVS